MKAKVLQKAKLVIKNFFANLDRKNPDKDVLGRKPYAQKIANEIVSRYDKEKRLHKQNKKKERENIIFAISGKWGEGKTTLLELLERRLSRKGFRVIRFNPWKYSQEDLSIKKAFLKNLNKHLRSRVDLDDLYFDRTRPVWTPQFKNALAVLLLLLANIAWLYIAVNLFAPEIYVKAQWKIAVWSHSYQTQFDLLKKTIKGIWPIIVVPILLKYIVLDKRTAEISTAEEFEIKFYEILGRNKRLVIFIDDLDRCDAKTVKLILDSLKTFFEHPECSYVITGDQTVIEKFAAQEIDLGSAVSTVRTQQGRRYLKKLFDVYWRLPLSTPKQFKNLLKDQISESNLSLSDDQAINIVTYLSDFDFFERNPRHTARFLTRLEFVLDSIRIQLDTLDSDDAEEIADSKKALRDILSHPDLMARVLLIDEFYQPIFEELIINPEHFIQHERHLRNGGDIDGLAGLGIQAILAEPGGKPELLKYARIVAFNPKFTNEEGIVVHEAANFLSASGSTGLAATTGPDLEKFSAYLRSGQLFEKLGGVLGSSTKENSRKYIETALRIFEECSQEEKQLVLRECLKVAETNEDWAEKLPDIEKGILSLPRDQQDSLLEHYLSVCLLYNPPQIEKFKTEHPELFNVFWSVIQKIDKVVLSEGVIEMIRDMVVSTPPHQNPYPYAVYSDKFSSSDVSREFKNALTTLEECRQTYRLLEERNIDSPNLNRWMKEKTGYLLEDQKNFFALADFRDLLDKTNLLNSFRTRGLDLALDYLDQAEIEYLIKRKADLEINGEEFSDKLLSRILKKKKYTLFENPTILSVFSIEQKRGISDELANVIEGGRAPVGERVDAAKLLHRNNPLWVGVDKQIIEESLVKIRRARPRTEELRRAIIEAIDSWRQP